MSAKERLRASDMLLWQHVSEKLLGGVLHAFGGRVSALSGIAAMARLSPLDGRLLSLLDQEVESLTDIIEASRILLPSPAELAGPSQLATLLPGIVKLLEMNMDARSLEVRYVGPDEGAAVDVDEASAARSVATLVTCVAWRALRSGGAALEVRLAVDGETVRVSGSFEGGEDGSGEDGSSDHAPRPVIPPDRVIREGLETIRAVTESFGGELRARVDRLPGSFALSWPALGAEASEESGWVGGLADRAPPAAPSMESTAGGA